MRTESELRSVVGIPRAAAILLIGMLGAGCTQPAEAPKPVNDSATVSQELTEKATVTALERTARLITVRDKDGRSWTARVAPEVRNYDQIEVGDSVVVRYQESLAVSLVKPGEAGAPPSAGVAVSRAELGQKPAVGVGTQITATVRIDSVDTAKNVVVFTGPSGEVNSVRVRRPEGQKFIQGLKPGDQVEITYTQAVALSVEKE